MSTRVLMIEDDSELADMLGEYLEANGLTFVCCGNASSGLAALEAQDFDALLLDIGLPDLDGLEVCRQVRERSSLAIIMLTARGDETDRIVGLELGADDYLPKPFNPRELLARLRAVLRRSRPEARGGAEILRFGELDIDRDARSVAIAGELRDLTGYQFDLLWELASNAGRVLSRDQLMQNLQGRNLEAFDRSIDTHVSRIRAAIEVDPHKPRRLLTVRGAGYVFSRKHVAEDSTE